MTTESAKNTAASIAERPDRAPELTITDPHRVPVTFVSGVLNQGIVNGVINVTLGTLNFTPSATEVTPDMVIASRLRMDLVCAAQLRDALDSLLTAAPADQKTH